MWSSDGPYRDVWVIVNSLKQALLLRRVHKTGERRLLASSCLSVCLSEWNNSAPTERIFMKFDFWVFFRRFIEKVQGSLNSDKNNGYFTCGPIYILLRMKNVSDKIGRGNQNALFVFELNFFSRKSGLL